MYNRIVKQIAIGSRMKWGLLHKLYNRSHQLESYFFIIRAWSWVSVSQYHGTINFILVTHSMCKHTTYSLVSWFMLPFANSVCLRISGKWYKAGFIPDMIPILCLWELTESCILLILSLLCELLEKVWSVVITQTEKDSQQQ